MKHILVFSIILHILLSVCVSPIQHKYNKIAYLEPMRGSPILKNNFPPLSICYDGLIENSDEVKIARFDLFAALIELRKINGTPLIMENVIVTQSNWSIPGNLGSIQFSDCTTIITSTKQEQNGK